MFRKVLVANRGEIAIRIMRACRELGIRTVAVFSEADADSLHARYADEAHPIGPAPAARSYLDIPRILEVARATRAEAIHPGYGFLSENPAFARACEESDVAFIGPRARVLERVGSKLSAREALGKAGLPLIPGTGPLGSAGEAREAAARLGYPVVLKAAGAGGGKGMRIIHRAPEVEGAFEAVRAVAESAFGGSPLYLERVLPAPRHIEVQLLADRRGRVVHLGERECSLQRRHQKFIEETPSPLLTPAMRRTLTALAVRAARAVGYTNAGTVEFLHSRGRFHFLEVNPRLQVEHSITEMVTGVDIVKTQMLLAAGQGLPFRQSDIQVRGWAMECRITAEDPITHAPSPGTITRYRSPGGVGIRMDSGVHMGYTIPNEYDPLIAKLSAWGRDRREAIQRMRRALYEYIIGGVRTNIPLCKAVLGHPAFQQGRLSTDFLDRHRIREQTRTILEFERTKELALASIFTGGREQAISTAITLAEHPTEETPGSPLSSPAGDEEEAAVVVLALEAYLHGDAPAAASRWLQAARREAIENLDSLRSSKFSKS